MVEKDTHFEVIFVDLVLYCTVLPPPVPIHVDSLELDKQLYAWNAIAGWLWLPQLLHLPTGMEEGAEFGEM
ncbi:hypothetical protein Syun_001769 [Stephania yunnanensis]|uniref:Uncharacterized protein n=1 Tax=Stephania yunnanensis TaxID=152371 RepID=A0AAP0Q839_9MAGN